jgi:hypothetical protein
MPRFVKLRENGYDVWVNADAVQRVCPDPEDDVAYLYVTGDPEPMLVLGDAEGIVRLLEDAKLEALSYGGTE